MKKIFAMLVTAAMLLALFAVSSVSASSSVPRFYLEGPSTAKAGDTITVKLLVSGDYQAHTLNLRVYFDNTSYSLKGKTFGEAYQEATSNGGWGMCELNKQKNAVSLGIMMISEPMSSEGELVSFDFDVLGTASENTEFLVTIEDFGFMPVGQSVASPIDYTTSGLTVKVTGGTGSGTTPNPIVTPKPGGNTGTNPGNSAAPTATQNNTSRETPAPGTNEPAGTTPKPAADNMNDPNVTETAENPVETAEPGTTDAAGETLAPGETEEPGSSAEPEGSETADASENPGEDPADKGGKVKPGAIVAICAAVIAAAAALVTVLTKRGKRKEK